MIKHIFTAAFVLLSQAAWAERPTVVELFTSQGCSSCPKADKVIRNLDEEEDIIALSFHVNYWDQLGWKDPFATEATTGRQRAYARHMQNKRIYTPQMIIDGKYDSVGSNWPSVYMNVHRAQMMQENIDVNLTQTEDGGFQIIIDKGEETTPADIWIIAYDKAHETDVERGENAGKHIKNYNVVRALYKAGEWTGEPVNIVLPPKEDMNDREIAVILQEKYLGSVLGAARLQ